jgi:hypothetical protein
MERKMHAALKGLAFVSGVLCATSALAADAAAPAKNACFFSSQFQNWTAADAKTIYIRVNTNAFYRLDMAASCSQLKSIDPHLITKFSGSNTVCSALDWNLSVSDGNISQACIVKKMTQLTPEEVSAIPKKFKP